MNQLANKLSREKNINDKSVDYNREHWNYKS